MVVIGWKGGRVATTIGTGVAIADCMRINALRESICSRRRRRGFTLLELQLVIMILGLVATIGYGNAVRFAERAKIASCVANQRHLHEASILWGIENDPGTNSFNANVLWAADLVQKKAAECPSSHNGTYDDYDLLFVGNEISIITCKVRGGLHPYGP